MDTRTLIAFALMIAIYFAFFQPKAPPPDHSNHLSSSQSLEVKPEPAPTESGKPESLEPALATRVFDLENGNLRVSLDALGSVQKVEILKYKEAVGSPKPVQYRFEPHEFNRSHLEINGESPLWSLVSSSSKLIQWRSSLPQAKLQRQVELVDSAYFLRYTDSIENLGTKSLNAGLQVRMIYPPITAPPARGFFQRIFSRSPEVFESLYFEDSAPSRHSLLSLDTTITKEGSLSSVGFAQKYFFEGLSPETSSIQSFQVKKLGSSGFEESLQFTPKQLSAKEASTYSYLIYLGPKEIPELERANPELRRVVDYGSWLGGIARFLLLMMRTFYTVIPNYGIAIILLTILVKLALFPLAWKSAVSMRKLQMVQPKMKEIRDRFKDDKNRLNLEMMALYRAEKVNPVGGCLPLLLQMPVFFALYRVFFASIELRHTPFFGWIRDLSAHDPLFVTPVLLTFLMWYQQKVTPQPPSADDSETAQAQRAMLKWMPLIFGAIMLFLPAGLTLYMLTNALLSILQQVYLNKKLHVEFPGSPKVAYKLKN